MPFYAIDEDELATLRRVVKRLYSENRMSGDEMRNTAQSLDAVVHSAENTPVED